MKKKIIILLVAVAFSAFVFGQSKTDNNPKHVNYYKIPEALNNNDITVSFEDIVSKTIKCRVLHKDRITDIKDQINLILRAKNIIVTDGSPYLINGLISLNSNIICIGNIVRGQILLFSEMRMLDSIIKSNNTVNIIELHTRTYTFKDIKQFLR